MRYRALRFAADPKRHLLRFLMRRKRRLPHKLLLSICCQFTRTSIASLYGAQCFNASVELTHFPLKRVFSPPRIYNKPSPARNTASSTINLNHTVFHLTDAIVTGESEIVRIRDNLAISCHSNGCATENCNFKDRQILATDGDTILLPRANVRRRVREAIMLTCRYPSNYYHFLYEVIARIPYIDEFFPRSKRAPLLIDAAAMQIPQLKELLDAANSTRREVILLEPGNQVEIGTLHVLPPTNLIPHGFRDLELVSPSDVQFDIRSLCYIRKLFLDIKSPTVFPKRLFISRSNASSRRKFNEDEVFSVCEQYGFEKIMPEQYSVASQVAMFHEAEIIVGGSGAAFANCISTTPSCKVICLNNYALPFSFFSTLCAFTGAEFWYLCGSHVRDNRPKQLHDAFYIDPGKVEALLKGVVLS